MSNKKWSKERIIKELIKINEKLNHPPSQTEIYNYYGNSCLVHACKRYFGSVDKARREAGFSIPKNCKHRLPNKAYKPSKPLSWLVGFILGDGNIFNNTITITTIDKEIKNMFIKNFKKWSNFKKFYVYIDKRKEQKFSNGKYYKVKDRINIRVTFKEASIFLQKFKNNPLYCLEFFPKKYWKYILKGLWDAEGSIFLTRKNYIRIVFSNTNKEILILYKKICSSLGFKFYVSKLKRNRVNIVIENLSDVINFIDIIGITIKRKVTPEIKKQIDIRRKLYNQNIIRR